MERRGFTLIELLVIVAIIGIMLGSAIMSVGSGSASAQMKSATRRVLQLSRQARTMALLRQQAAVITYEEIYDGQTLVGGKVTIESKGEAAASRSSSGGQPLTLSGEIPEENGEPIVTSESDANSISKEQELMEKIVDDPQDYAPDKVDASDWDPDSPRSFRGIHLKVELLDDEGTAFGERKSRISVFSNVDFLRRQSQAAEAARASKSEKEEDVQSNDEKNTPSVAAQEPVSIVYEANGRCQPHRIKVWKDGTDEDSGLTVTVDRFGKTKVEDER